jgi:hypothetical protein
VVVYQAWQQALDLLRQDGIEIAEDERELVETVRRDFESISESVQRQPEYVYEAPKLAAWMVSYALERERMGLTEYESF